MVGGLKNGHDEGNTFLLCKSNKMHRLGLRLQADGTAEEVIRMTR